MMRRGAAHINPEQLGAGGGAIAAWRDGAEDLKSSGKGGWAFRITRNDEEGP